MNNVINSPTCPRCESKMYLLYTHQESGGLIPNYWYCCGSTDEIKNGKVVDKIYCGFTMRARDEYESTLPAPPINADFFKELTKIDKSQDMV